MYKSLYVLLEAYLLPELDPIRKGIHCPRITDIPVLWFSYILVFTMIFVIDHFLS